VNFKGEIEMKESYRLKVKSGI